MPEILNSLKRLVGDVITHPMTIGKVISNYGPKRKKGYPKSLHLVGTGNIEVTRSVCDGGEAALFLEMFTNSAVLASLQSRQEVSKSEYCKHYSKSNIKQY